MPRTSYAFWFSLSISCSLCVFEKSEEEIAGSPIVEDEEKTILQTKEKREIGFTKLRKLTNKKSTAVIRNVSRISLQRNVLKISSAKSIFVLFFLYFSN